MNKKYYLYEKVTPMPAVKSHHTALVTTAVLAVGVVVTSALQFAIGDFPVGFFAFPMNVVVAALWLLALAELYRHRRESAVAKYLLSPSATYLSLALAAVCGVAAGIMAELPTRQWWFVTALFFVMSHLVLVTLRGWRNAEGVRWRFLLNHAGLLMTLGAGFWGAPDIEELRLPLIEGRPTSDAYVREGRSVPLGYEMSLLDFEAEYYDNGTPSDFAALVDIAGREVTLRVNSPHRHRLGEDIYLVSHEKDLAGRSHCIVQIVRDGWAPIMAFGVVLMLAGAALMFAATVNMNGCVYGPPPEDDPFFKPEASVEQNVYGPPPVMDETAETSETGETCETVEIPSFNPEENITATVYGPPEWFE